jgi:hypothetical protein
LCERQQSRVIEYAEAAMMYGDIGDVPWNPTMALEYCRGVYGALGYTEMIKPTWLGVLGEYSTTWPGCEPHPRKTIFLDQDWDSIHIAQQAMFACHEAEHAMLFEILLQDQACESLLLDLANPEFLLGVELPAYMHNIDRMLAWGLIDEPQAKAEQYAKQLSRDYPPIAVLDSGCVREVAMEFWGLL